MGFEGLNTEDNLKGEDPNFLAVEEAIINAIINSKIQNEVYAQKDVREFLTSISLDDAMDWADRIDRFNVWQIVLGRPDLDRAKAIACAEKYHDTKVNAIVEDYLKNNPAL